MQSLSYRSQEDLFASIAARRIPTAVVIERLNTAKAASDDNEEILKIFSKSDEKYKPSACGVIVPGIDTIQVALSPCCAPIPGDEIVGYVSKGKGVKVHRKDCPNIAKEQKRLIPVYWSDELEDKTYSAHLQIDSEDRNYLLSDLVTVFQQNGSSIKSINSTVDNDSLMATTKIEIGIKNAEQLEQLIANLKKVRSVVTVTRTIL